MNDWRLTQLTFGSDASRFHTHSYYDIPVWNDAGTRIAGVQTSFAGRHPSPDDAVEVGLIDADTPGSWEPVATSTAWSWQQGPMAQWVPGRDALVWNDREDGQFVARLREAGGGPVTTLARPVYALMPDGLTGLSVNMARLDVLRPGYGYATVRTGDLDRVPDDDGVWRVPLDGSAQDLILPLDRAVAFLHERLSLIDRLKHRLAGYHYWFNHVKVSPGGGRFTVKLRWRKPDGKWHGGMGVSLTCGTDGSDLHLLGRATSHVIWLDDTRLYFYDEGRRKTVLKADTAPVGRDIGTIGEGIIQGNIHLRHLPPHPPAHDALPERFVFDTPYREEVALLEMDGDGANPRNLAEFTGHVPAEGPFRCDLHPCPDRTGDRIAVTSLQDGGRQIYVLDRHQ